MLSNFFSENGAVY